MILNISMKLVDADKWPFSFKFELTYWVYCSSFSPSRQRRYLNRPIVELEIAAQEQMKVTELRFSKLFSLVADAASKTKADQGTDVVNKAGGICSFNHGPMHSHLFVFSYHFYFECRNIFLNVYFQTSSYIYSIFFYFLYLTY